MNDLRGNTQYSNIQSPPKLGRVALISCSGIRTHVRVFDLMEIYAVKRDNLSISVARISGEGVGVNKKVK